MSTPDIERTVRVDRPIDDAFRLFTDGIGRWWPLEHYSYGGGRSAGIHLEPWVGGRFYEQLVDGDVLQVGTVTRCDPPRSIVFTWAAPDWAAQTEVTVSFSEDADGTDVAVAHRFFDRVGPEGGELRNGFAGGWTEVLRSFADAAGDQASSERRSDADGSAADDQAR